MASERAAGRRWTATSLAAVGLILALTAKLRDTPGMGRAMPPPEETARPAVGARVVFEATGYCVAGTTTSGVTATSGVAASDPTVLPAGSVIRIESQGKYNGIYAVLDTGPTVLGRRLDVFFPTCVEAQQFGRRKVPLTILRLGWDPKAVAPAQNREAVRATAPAPEPARSP